MAKTLVRNYRSGVATLPSPYNRILGPGEAIILNEAASSVLTKLGMVGNTLAVRDVLESNQADVTGFAGAGPHLVHETLGLSYKSGLTGSDAGTDHLFNTRGARSAGLLADYQNNSVSKFSVNSAGLGLFVGGITATLVATLDGGAIIADAKNVALGTTTGSQLGSAADQKLSLWGVAPVVQPVAGGGITSGFVAGIGAAVLDDSTFTGANGDGTYTIGDIVDALKNLGALAVSAP